MDWAECVGDAALVVAVGVGLARSAAGFRARKAVITGLGAKSN